MCPTWAHIGKALLQCTCQPSLAVIMMLLLTTAVYHKSRGAGLVANHAPLKWVAAGDRCCIHSTITISLVKPKHLHAATSASWYAPGSFLPLVIACLAAAATQSGVL